jgi:hypothetical protein
MKHARQDYQTIQDSNPNTTFGEDEPVFLLRAKDKFAPELLLRWAAKLRLNGGDPYMAIMVENHAQEMIEWQSIFGSKLPDL